MPEAGELRYRVEILAAGEKDDLGRWPIRRVTWAGKERSKDRTIFSSMGLAAVAEVFTLRSPGVRPGEVIRLHGQWYYVTAAEETERGWWSAIGALVRPVDCVSDGTAFTGFLTDPYVAYSQPQEPYSVNTVRYVLVTAKNIMLDPGRLVRMETLGDWGWPIKTGLYADAVKNEYLLERTGDL